MRDRTNFTNVIRSSLLAGDTTGCSGAGGPPSRPPQNPHVTAYLSLAARQTRTKSLTIRDMVRDRPIPPLKFMSPSWHSPKYRSMPSSVHSSAVLATVRASEGEDERVPNGRANAALHLTRISHGYRACGYRSALFRSHHKHRSTSNNGSGRKRAGCTPIGKIDHLNQCSHFDRTPQLQRGNDPRRLRCRPC